jgi:hypothetical protein
MTYTQDEILVTIENEFLMRAKTKESQHNCAEEKKPGTK